MGQKHIRRGKAAREDNTARAHDVQKVMPVANEFATLRKMLRDKPTSTETRQKSATLADRLGIVDHLTVELIALAGESAKWLEEQEAAQLCRKLELLHRIEAGPMFVSDLFMLDQMKNAPGYALWQVMREEHLKGAQTYDDLPAARQSYEQELVALAQEKNQRIK